MTDGHDQLVGRIATARATVLEAIDIAGGKDIIVVAVTKSHPVEVVIAAAEAGFEEFGESYAGELLDKASVVGADAPRPSVTGSPAPWAGRWHFIGQLQTNKVRKVAPYVSLYQSVDRAGLVDEIARRDPGARVLVQVNLASIPGRGGASEADVPALIERARRGGLEVEGVMGVAPPAAEAEVASAFRRLRRICDVESLRHCSMGMSDDFRVAVSEGATMLRLGSVLFGARH